MGTIQQSFYYQKRIKQGKLFKNCHATFSRKNQHVEFTNMDGNLMTGLRYNGNDPKNTMLKVGVTTARSMAESQNNQVVLPW